MMLSKNKSLYHSKEFRLKIIDEIVYPSIERQLNNSLIWKNKWKKIYQHMDFMSQIILGFATIFDFSESYFDYKWLALIGGSLGVISLILNRFSTFAKKETTEKEYEVEILVKYYKDAFNISLEDFINQNQIYKSRRNSVVSNLHNNVNEEYEYFNDKNTKDNNEYNIEIPEEKS